MPRLGDLDESAAETENIAHAHVRFGKPNGAHILAKGARPQPFLRKIGEIATPRGVVLPGVVMYGLVRPTVIARIALFVTLEAGDEQAQRPSDATFVDAAGLAVRPEGNCAADQEVENLHRRQFVHNPTAPSQSAKHLAPCVSSAVPKRAVSARKRGTDKPAPAISQAWPINQRSSSAARTSG